MQRQWKLVEVRGGRRGRFPQPATHLGLGFDDADGPAVCIEQVVGKAGFQGELTDRHARSRRDVHVPVFLYDPAALGKLVVNLPTGLFFGRYHGDGGFLGLLSRIMEVPMPSRKWLGNQQQA